MVSGGALLAGQPDRLVTTFVALCTHERRPDKGLQSAVVRQPRPHAQRAAVLAHMQLHLDMIPDERDWRTGTAQLRWWRDQRLTRAQWREVAEALDVPVTDPSARPR